MGIFKKIIKDWFLKGMKALIKKKSQLGKIIIPKLAGTAKLTKNISLKNVGMP